jgi:hypothetical protein
MSNGKQKKRTLMEAAEAPDKNQQETIRGGAREASGRANIVKSLKRSSISLPSS